MISLSQYNNISSLVYKLSINIMDFIDYIYIINNIKMYIVYTVHKIFLTFLKKQNEIKFKSNSTCLKYITVIS